MNHMKTNVFSELRPRSHRKKDTATPGARQPTEHTGKVIHSRMVTWWQTWQRLWSLSLLCEVRSPEPSLSKHPG